MNTETEKTFRKDIYFVDVRKIKVIEGFNVRIDYGDMDELTESIRVNGIKEPLHGYKEKGTEYYILLSGHRRLKAAHTLNEIGIELRAPFIIDKEKSQEQRLVDMIIYNEGKKFNPLEEAEVISRLVNYHLTESEIADKLGKSLVYISNLNTLHNAPTRIKNLVKDNIITATLAMDILRANKGDGEKAFEIINEAIQQKNVTTATSEEVIPELFEKEPETEKPVIKVTKKDIEKIQNKVNSVTAFRKVCKIALKKDLSIKNDKIELYQLLVDFTEGRLNQDYLMNYFFDKPLGEDLSCESEEESVIAGEKE